MNKSRVARDLWRKIFNENIIDLKDGDARKQVVREFLADPVNKKAGWKSKDARFMRLGFQKVAKENNFNVMNIGLNPTPIRSKTQKGSLNINVKSKQKNPSPMMDAIKPPTEEQKKFGAIPTTPQLENQQAQAVYYSAQSVGQMCETCFNIAFTRMGVEPITQNERIALGEAYAPLCNKYLTGHSDLIMPLIITLPIVLSRLAQMAKLKKEKEVRERYGIDDIPKKEEVKKKPSWIDEMNKSGKNKTDKK